jgi:hypothetical protein
MSKCETCKNRAGCDGCTEITVIHRRNIPTITEVTTRGGSQSEGYPPLEYRAVKGPDGSLEPV